MAAFVFDPKVFVQPGFEHSDGDWSDESKAQIDLVRIRVLTNRSQVIPFLPTFRAMTQRFPRSFF